MVWCFQMPDTTASRGSLSARKRQLPDWTKYRKSKGTVWKVTVSFQYRVLAQQSLALLGHHFVCGWGTRESMQKSGYKLPTGAVTDAKERIRKDTSCCQQTPEGWLRCAPNASVSFCLPPRLRDWALCRAHPHSRCLAWGTVIPWGGAIVNKCNSFSFVQKFLSKLNAELLMKQ